MSARPAEDDQAAATSAFLAAMQRSHEQMQQHQKNQGHSPTSQSPTLTSPSRKNSRDGDATNGDGQNGQPPRKAQRRPSTATAKESHTTSHSTDSAQSVSSSAAAAPASTSTDAPAGPPYICPTCQTSYSRLEYLRRHERRHQDIRPFVCECGKGFSRSDVLSRHKRQCHYHLTGEQPSPEAAEAASKKTRKPSVAKSRKRSSVTSQDNGGAGVGPVPPRSSDNGNGARAGSKRDSNGSPGPLSQSPPPTSLMGQPGSYSAAQPGPPPPLLPHANIGQGSSALPPPPPFYPHGSSGGQEHGTNANTSDYSRTYNFMTAISHALNNFGQPHPNYPPSPESSASLNSRNSSPRLHYRDTIPYTHRSGSTGSSRQSSLRKGTLDPYHAPPPWELQDGNRSSPAPGSAPSSRPGSVYGGGSRTASNNPSSNGGPGVGSGVGLPGFSSSTSSAAPAFSYPANEFASTGPNSSTGSQQSQTLAPASDATSSSSQAQASTPATTRTTEPPRFSVPSGPLSPFSGMGLSSMSPYLSAFSNARDTPLVASPGRGVAPGTPTSSLNTNVFDYTMRPPPKPASATTPSRTGSGSAGHSDKAAASSSSNGHIGSVPLKRKESAQRDEPTTPSASVAMSVSNSGSLPALADFIDDQQRSAANGLLTLLGGGGAETPSRFVRSEANADGGSSQGSTRQEGNSSMENNPGTTSANPSSNPFFELAVTPGPEAFLLRLQGGEQERRAGLLTSSASSGQLMRPTMSNGGSITNAFSNGGAPTSVLGSGLDTPSYFDGLLGAQWEALAPSGTPGQASSVGWLMSPSINTLLGSFANGMTPRGPGEGGSYFPLSRRQSGVGGVASMKPTNHLSDRLLGSGGSGAAASPLRNVHTPGTGAIFAKDIVQDDEDTGWLGNTALEQALDDVSNPFFIPKAMFRSCYSITHWELPPLTRLSMLAMHAQQNLLKHVPILHEPTFRLDTTPGCLAFAACMLGCHEVGRRWWAGEEVVPLQKRAQDGDSVDGATGNTQNASAAVRAEVKALVDEEDGMELVKPVVMTEKMDMLMRSFAGKCKSEKDKVSVVQAMMLFQTNNFLSSDATTRAIASISHGSVVSMARKAGFYDPEAKHVPRDIRYTPEEVVRSTVFGADNLCFGFSFLPSYIPNCTDEEKVWRQWCDYEGRRRTAFLIFLMDTVASLDAGLPALVELEELEHLPLPSPDTIWRASNAEAFRTALASYDGPTFGEAMKDLLRTDDSEASETGSKAPEPTGEQECSPGHCISGAHGPFARLVIILPILRGIVHLLQGRAEKAAKPSPLEPWLPDRDYAASQCRDGSVDNDWQVELFKRALSRWRKAWDEDESCLHASSPAAQAKAASQSPNGSGSDNSSEQSKPADVRASSSPASGPATPLFTSKTASGATPLCEDALPFYWLCHVLLGHATSRPVPRRRSPGSRASTSPEQAFASINTSASASDKGTNVSVDSTPSSRTTTADTAMTSASPPIFGPVPPGAAPGSVRVPDFRSMLRFAKVFVNSSEGAHGMAGMMGGPVTALGLGLAPGAGANGGAKSGSGLATGIGIGSTGLSSVEAQS